MGSLFFFVSSIGFKYNAGVRSFCPVPLPWITIGPKKLLHTGLQEEFTGFPVAQMILRNLELSNRSQIVLAISFEQCVIVDCSILIDLIYLHILYNMTLAMWWFIDNLNLPPELATGSLEHTFISSYWVWRKSLIWLWSFPRGQSVAMSLCGLNYWDPDHHCVIRKQCLNRINDRSSLTPDLHYKLISV